VTLADQVRAAGVVGAGGGGFPAHVKLAARADIVIANGAECEPLLHKDAAVMEHFAERVVAGVRLSMEAVGAREGVVAIKAKNRHAVEEVEAACRGTPVRVQLLGDYYPAGDEYDLVHAVTGRLIPPAGLPLAVGCVVNNVETLANVASAHEGEPVTRKTITVAGAVREPATLTVPVGTSFRDCLAMAGGLATEDVVLCLGGLMMGEVTTNLDTPVVKTSTGVVVLPRDHHVARRKLTPPKAQAGIGKSACDQCRYCTEYCPRFLLGYRVEPHQVMRGLSFTATGATRWNEWAALCCSCGLCTLYACPEELFPKEACDEAKAGLRQAGFRWTGAAPSQPHPLHEGRRVPIRSLMKRLHVQQYEHPAPWRPESPVPPRVVLLLKQHAGAAARAIVRPGDGVTVGQAVAEMADGALGARVHASIAGIVESVDDRQIVLARVGTGTITSTSRSTSTTTRTRTRTRTTGSTDFGENTNETGLRRR
jgi:Na+-translocating ferredoxin:NAD+ oxidoreductase RnfC subunit